MKSALGDHLGTDIRAPSNILPWLIEYASVLINRYEMGANGKTGFERVRGKPSKMLGVEFGEKPNFRRVPLPGRLGRLDSLCHQGLLVGYKFTSGNILLSTTRVLSERVRGRLPVEERWRRDDVKNS